LNYVRNKLSCVRFNDVVMDAADFEDVTRLPEGMRAAQRRQQRDHDRQRRSQATQAAEGSQGSQGSQAPPSITSLSNAGRSAAGGAGTCSAGTCKQDGGGVAGKRLSTFSEREKPLRDEGAGIPHNEEDQKEEMRENESRAAEL
jgi:hypothetical protein